MHLHIVFTNYREDDYRGSPVGPDRMPPPDRRLPPGARPPPPVDPLSPPPFGNRPSYPGDRRSPPPFDRYPPPPHPHMRGPRPSFPRPPHPPIRSPTLGTAEHEDIRQGKGFGFSSLSCALFWRLFVITKAKQY